MSSSGAIRAGKAFVEVGAVTDPLRKGLKSAAGMLNTFGANAAKIGGSLLGGGLAILTPLTAAVGQFADAGDKLDKMSARTGASTAALSALGFAAEQSGSNIDALGSALFRMNRRIANATTGAGPAKRALEDLGLSADELTKLDSDQQLIQVADALSKVEDESLAAQYAFEILGDGGKALLPLMKAGAGGIQEMMEEAQRLGLVVDESQAKSAAAFADAKNRITRSIGAIVFGIGGALAPAFTEVGGFILDNVQVVREWISENKSLIQIVALGGAALVALGGVFMGLAGTAFVAAMGLSVMATAAGVLGGILGAILSPIGLVVAGVVGIGAAILYYSGAGSRALAWLSENFQELASFASQTFGTIKKAMDAGEYGLAAKTLWAAIKVAWMEGTEGLSVILSDWKGFFSDTWESTIDWAAGVFINQWANLQTVWAKVTQFFGDAWDIVVGGIVDTWKSAQNTIADYALEVIAAVDPSIDKEAARAELYSMQEQEKEDRTAAQNKRITDREAETRAEINAIAANRDVAAAELDEEAQRRADAREARLKQARQAAKDATEEARAELRALTAEVNNLPDPENSNLVNQANKNKDFENTPAAQKALGGSGGISTGGGLDALVGLINAAGRDMTLDEMKTQTGLLAELVDLYDTNKPKVLKANA